MCNYFTYMSHTVAFFLILSSIMRQNSFVVVACLFSISVLLDDVLLHLKCVRCAIVFLRSALCRKSVITMKCSKGNTTNTKATIITSGESKLSVNGSAVMKIINCKMTPSNLLRISLLYGLTIMCIKAIIPQAVMSI